MGNLFQLSKYFEQAVMAVNTRMESDNFEELTADEIESLIGNFEKSKEDFEKKSLDMANYLTELKHQMNAVKAEQDRFKAKLKTLTNKHSFYMNLMQEYMLANSIEKISNDTVNISMYENPQYSTEVRDIQKLPEKYQKVETKANTAGLKKDLKAILEIKEQLITSDDEAFKKENAWVNEVEFTKGKHIRIK